MPRRRKDRQPRRIYKRGSVYWGRIVIRGRELRWSLRTGDARIAESRVDARHQREIAAQYFGDQRRSYDEAFIAWAAWIAGQVSPSTAKRYAVSHKQLAPWLRPLHLDEITSQVIGAIVRERQAAGVTVATLRRDLTALSSFLEFCQAEEWREGNPCLTWLRRLRERRDPIHLPEPAHVERVIARAPGMLAALTRAAWATGCRQDELVSAKRPQLDRGRRQLTIVGKGSKRRTIDLDPFGGFAILDALPAWLGEPWLFWHDDGQPYRNVSSRFAGFVAAELRAAIERAGPGRTPDFRPFRFHDLRHLHAVQWLKSGRSIYVLQKRLGHKSIKTTEIYLDFLTAEEQHACMYGSGELRDNVGQ